MLFDNIERKQRVGRPRGPFFYNRGDDPVRVKMRSRLHQRKRKELNKESSSNKTTRLIGRIKIRRGCESGCCPVEGEMFPEDLCFHHAIGKKEIIVSDQNPRKKRFEEMEKCLVLCHICHNRYHAGRFDLTEAIKKRWPDVDLQAVVQGAAYQDDQKTLF